MADIVCANCLKYVKDEECQGESGLFSPTRAYMLCEPCFLEEDRLIDEQGTNDMPERLQKYKNNLANVNRSSLSWWKVKQDHDDMVKMVITSIG